MRFFRLSLAQQAGAKARAYLGRRGLQEDALARWQIGFAPPGWHNLWQHLRGKGVAEEVILAAGLARRPSEQGKTAPYTAPYDVFRNRIIFPIQDRRGRCIAFGGRALDAEATAKYLNSPETALFAKSHCLFNHGRAQAAAGRGQPLVVAEGYIDVIALVEAGFAAAVAPLGTAVSSAQLQLLWRMADEPILTLDGDTAGRQAGYRLLDRALPLLEAGKALRFALLPQGQDPDDVIRAAGPRAMQNLLDAAVPMVQLLWQRDTEGKRFDTPERKAGLAKILRARVAEIRDSEIRRHYDSALRDLRWQLFQSHRTGGNPAAQRPRHTQPGTAYGAKILRPALLATRHSRLAASDRTDGINLREAVILALAVATPAVIEEVEPELMALDCQNPAHEQIRDALLLSLANDEITETALSQAIGTEALDSLHKHPQIKLLSSLSPAGDVKKAQRTIGEEFAKLSAERELQSGIAEAQEDLRDLREVADETITWRLREAKKACHAALHGPAQEAENAITGANGVPISQQDHDDFQNAFEGGATRGSEAG